MSREQLQKLVEAVDKLYLYVRHEHDRSEGNVYLNREERTEILDEVRDIIFELKGAT